MSLPVVDHRRLTEKIATAAATHVAGQPRKRSNNFHASSYIDCLRAPAYDLLGYAPSDATYDLDYDMAARQGDAIHTALQHAMIHAGLVMPWPGHRPADPGLPAGYAVELPLTTIPARYLLSGRIDAVLQIDRYGAREYWLMDIKTISAKYLEPGYRWLEEKIAHWRAQLQCYLHFFRLPDGTQLTNAYIYVVCRDDTKQRRLYSVSYDEAWTLGELERVATATVAVKAGQLPKAEVKRGPCRFCAFRRRCAEDMAGGGH